jgi:chromosome segregation ATPase
VTDKLALGLLHTKSVEIESLEQSVAREQAKAEDYVVKIRQLESRLAQASSAVTKELELELEHQLAEARREISDARLAWEADRAGLESTIACLESAKASADKDTAFFREQYANASAHVTHVQSANEELEERTMIAEGRVRENVGILKGLYEERLARLEGEANRWRALCQVLRLKDERTTDFVRSEAAEAVELRGKLRKVRIEADELQGEVESMEEENEELRRTVNSLKLEKAALMAQLKDSPTGQGVVRTGSMDAVREGSGSQEVYRCLWMQNESGKHERCEQFFASIGVSDSCVGAIQQLD